MTFKLVEVDFDTEFEELIDCEWISYENPVQNFFQLFFPTHGTGPGARAECQKEGISRQLAWHSSDPTSLWHKVVNEQDTIVGGVLWKICPTNPFEHSDDHEVTWWPEGEQRNYVAAALDRFDAPRMRMGARPQVCRLIMKAVVIPKYSPMSHLQTRTSSSHIPIIDARAWRTPS